MTALAMELISHNLRRAPSQSSVLERSEYARRDKDMLWYLLRGSVWQNYTRSVSTSWMPEILLIQPPDLNLNRL